MARDLHYLTKNSIHMHGKNVDIDIASPEDIWTGGSATDWVAPTAARTHDIASTSSSDDAAGVGARTVQIYGLDGNWNLQNETVTMDGVTDVVTTNSYLRIHRMVVRTVGAVDNQNFGTITATANTDATVTNEIAIGLGQSATSIMTTPSDGPARLIDFWGSNSLATASAEVSLWIRPQNQSWQFLRGTNAFSESAQEFQVPYFIPEKTDVKLRGTTPTDNNQFDGGYTLVFPDDFDLGETD